MKIKIFQVDAFTDKIFSGNPAAVCPLDKWLSDELMQNIAKENNLSETAFFVRIGEEYHIRWFTPSVEVDLCGHATLTSGFVIFNLLNYDGTVINFYSRRSGKLRVKKDDDLLTLDFPADENKKTDSTTDFDKCFNIKPVEVYKGKTDYMLVYDREEQIKDLIPDFREIMKTKARGIIVTAKGDKVDFVSRFFAPQSGVNEDPVTGSAHTSLTPYWSKILGKKELTAVQLSERKGFLKCRLSGSRVEISGHARLYMTGEIYLD
ncbi:MAG: PhzF family phenazine biosynthesis protein [Ignavibacteria bacterium]|nr:PhzF family phenazine biosynthesis protein [Ignavibacteria bacterium]